MLFQTFFKVALMFMSITFIYTILCRAINLFETIFKSKKADIVEASPNQPLSNFPLSSFLDKRCQALRILNESRGKWDQQ